MGKRISNTVWGLIFIVIGIGAAGNMTGIWDINPFFNGWWTLFLIIPAFTSIIQNGIKIFNSIFLVLGLALLACCLGYLPWEALYRLAVPMVMILIGLVMVGKNLFHIGGRRVEFLSDSRREELVVFSGKNLVVNDYFYGIDGDAIFGGLTIDLRNAKIEQDISIDAMAVFGGVDILLPANVSVKLNETSLFGGCSTRRTCNFEGIIVYVNAIALFGGVEVK